MLSLLGINDDQIIERQRARASVVELWVCISCIMPIRTQFIHQQNLVLLDLVQKDNHEHDEENYKEARVKSLKHEEKLLPATSTTPVKLKCF